jgi:osmoprotectant transport system permease protein
MMSACITFLMLGSNGITVGSKAFTESVVLGEMAAAVIETTGLPVQHAKQLGGSRLVFEALVKGEIDVYPDYTGTLKEEIFAGEDVSDDVKLAQALGRRGLKMTGPLGFNNTYALAMREDSAQGLGVVGISDLARHTELRPGLSNEFLQRKDGWQAVAERYGLKQPDVRGLDHDVAYQALLAEEVDFVDVYTTDAEIAHYGLRVLDDDRNFFPAYQAVFVYRADLSAEAERAVASLASQVSAAQMSALNAEVRLQRKSEGEVARGFLKARNYMVVDARPLSTVERIVLRSKEHLFLVGLALLLSMVLALPVGVAAAKFKRVGQLFLSMVSVGQTIPSLALLVLGVPLLGIGAAPAIVAMVFYGLLPIARNTYTGITSISPTLQESARALGLNTLTVLFQIELPLAAPQILAGIQTSAVVSVGTATIGALVGAGGYGQPILSGIRLADTALILEGAIPAAVLALLTQLLFLALERLVVSKGLRAV